MGLFNISSAPGKGVSKNEKKKRGFFLYVDILWNKMFKLVGANCLYSITSILWIAALYLFFGFVIQNTVLIEYIAKSMPEAGSSEIAEAVVMLQIFFATVVFVMWGSGPSSAAYAYVNRCFTRSEPVWVASDGWDKFKENFKQSMVVVVIDALFLFFALFSLFFYRIQYGQSHSFIWMLAEYVIMIAVLIYTMMHSYIYQLMVTFECSIASLYKNAVIITIAKLPGTIAVNLISAGFLWLIFAIINLNALFAALIVMVFGLCFSRYVTDFYAARVIDRNILKNMKSKKANEPVIEYLGEEETE